MSDNFLSTGVGEVAEPAGRRRGGTTLVRLHVGSRLAAVAVTAATALTAAGQVAAAAPAGGDGSGGAFLGPLHTVSAVASTVPGT